jgi:hypothetical protein
MVPLMGLAFALASVSGAIAAGLRSIRAAKENLYLAVVMVPILAASSLVGGIVWGVEAAIGGICVGYGINTIAGWVILVRCARRITPGSLAERDGSGGGDGDGGADAETIVPIEADNQTGVLPSAVVFETAEPV